MQRVLENIGYIVVAIAVLIALFTGFVLLSIICTVLGMLLQIIVAIFFTATTVKEYFKK